MPLSELLEALRRLAGDAELRASTGIRAREVYDERHTVARHLDAIDDVIATQIGVRA